MVRGAHGYHIGEAKWLSSSRDFLEKDQPRLDDLIPIPTHIAFFA
jgi:hypothetical protein